MDSYSFQAYWDRVNGKMYRKGRPTEYDLADYAAAVTSNPINNVEGGSDYNYTPISQEDMARYGAEDVVAYSLKYGKDTTKLGPPMTDMSFKKFMGQKVD